MIIVILLIILFLLLVITNTNTNEHFELEDNNYSIIKPYKKNYAYYGLKIEVEPIELITLLSDLKKENENKSQTPTNNEFIKTTPNILDSDYINTRKWIVDSISNTVLSSPKFKLLQNKLHYEVIHQELNSFEMTEDESIKKYIFVLTLHRKNADIGFIIYFDISNYINENIFTINNFKLLGTPIEDEIRFGKLTNHSKNHLEDCSMSHPSHDCNSLMSYDENYIENNMEFLDTVKLEHARSTEESLYKCFGKIASNEIECISKEYEQTGTDGEAEVVMTNKKGIWAKSKCTIDEECPYYLANQNYTNRRGGCVNGECEMPLMGGNLNEPDALTPTIPNPNKKPICHNCNKQECEGLDCFNCCEDQENTDLYPMLSSPDYAFYGDIEHRLDQKDKFEINGYSPYKFSF